MMGKSTYAIPPDDGGEHGDPSGNGGAGPMQH
jgi:hypothetical protein